MTINVARAIALVLAVTCTAPPARAETSPPASPSDAIFAGFGKAGPGLAAMVTRGTATVYARGFGTTDIEHGGTVSTATPFHAASISKQFTGLAILLLAAEGKVELDADIRRYLPYVPDFGHKITVTHLLQHTSGLRDQWVLFSLSGNDGESMRRQGQVVELVRRQTALNFEPGSEFSYCNTGYTLLAEIVRAVSGQSLRAYTTAKIFQPLGMKQTFFYDDAHELIPGRAESYSVDKDGRPKRSRLNFETVGATGLSTTAADLARWGRELLHPAVLPAAVLRQLQQPGQLNDGTRIRYGAGIMSGDVAGHAWTGHGGSDAGYRAMFMAFPADDVVITLLASGQADASGLAQALAEQHLTGGRRSAPEPVAPPPGRIAALAGYYDNDARGGMRLEVSGERLVRRAADAAEAAAVFYADGSFDFGSGGNRFRPVESDGRVTGLAETNRLGGHPLAHRRVETDRPSPEQLAALAGDWRSSELDITYSFTVQGGRLAASTLQRPAPVLFEPSSLDRFDSSFARLKVRRAADGRPDALLLDAGGGRVLNLVLTRVAAPS